MQFKIDIINPDPIIDKYHLPEIVSPIIQLPTGEFNNGSLFSPTIYGEPDSDNWNNQFAYINLNVYAFHPLAYDISRRHFQIIPSIINREKGLVFQDNTTTIKSFSKQSDITGFSVLKKYYSQIISYLKQTKPEHRKLLDKISNPDKVFITKWLVIPPKYRGISKDPITGEISYHPINDVYVSIIKNAQRASVTSVFTENDMSSKVITNDLYRLFSLEVDLIKGKQGLFRGSVLGRRVDFSTRSVVVADPSLPTEFIGLPKTHALKVFLPFVIHYISTRPEIFSKVSKMEGVNSVTELLDLLQRYVDGRIHISEDTEKLLLDAVLPEVVKDKVVVFKRDPVLHRTSIMAAYVRLVDDNAIHIPVTVVGHLNMDFDGDSLISKIRLRVAGDEIKNKFNTDFVHIESNILSFRELEFF